MSPERLTGKQEAFCQYFVILNNATEAAKQAGYKGSRNSLAAIGHENLRKPHIIARINELYSRHAMGAEETLARLAKIARSFDPIDYIIEREVFTIDRKGNAHPSGFAISFDWKRLQSDGYSQLIKKIKQNSKGGIECEFHDPQTALTLIAKNHKLLTDRIDHTTKGESLHVKGYLNVSPDDFPDKPRDKTDDNL
jgi:hypothetical protein